MPRYSFTIEVGGVDPTESRYEDALYEAGCDDALVAVIDGRVVLDFDREGMSYDRAVASAIQDVERAGARVVDIRRGTD